MSLTSRTAFGYAAAIGIPILFAAGWSSLPHSLREVPTILFLLLVSLVARFCGFHPALLFTLISSAVVSFSVFGFVTAEPAPLLLRVGLYIAASLVIASMSRQRAEEAQEAEERFRALVELAPDGIGIADENGRVIFANDALARLLGASDPRDLIGRINRDFAHSDYREEFGRRWARLGSGQAVPWIVAKWVKLDGTPIDVEVAGVPVHNRGKTLYQGFVRDLTEKKRAEAKLEENRSRLQALFDTAIDAIIFIDSDGHYIDANPACAALTGYEHDEILRMKAGDLAVPDRKEEVISRISQDLLTGSNVNGELTIIRKDGETREVEYRGVANVIPGLHYAVMHDITARKNAERSLHELSGRLLRLQDEERRRIARELHDTTAQNLAALRMNLSKFGRWAADSDQTTKDAVAESIALADQSISEIRTLSYLLHPPLIDEAGLLPSLRWFTRGFQERSGIAVTLIAPTDLDRLPSEVETALFRIVQEALTNVQRHSGSTVAIIRLEKQPGSVRLEIEDEGRGLPTNLREHADALTAAGVGIAGIQQRVRELGGRVDIGSEDRGTKIVVTLPILEG